MNLPSRSSRSTTLKAWRTAARERAHLTKEAAAVVADAVKRTEGRPPPELAAKLANLTRMKCPAHPGEVIADTVLRKEGGLTLSSFARHLGVSRVSLSRVVNRRGAVSAELAIRLAAALGGSAESWLTMQLAYDLARAKARRRPRIQRVPVKSSPRKLTEGKRKGAARVP
jgi:addiction module HigA family antidote